MECKARGLGMSVQRLQRPCMLLHQTHPSPVQVMQYVRPGWEWSNELCESVAADAQSFLTRVQSTESGDVDGGRHEGGVRSMHRDWGWPAMVVGEERVPAAGPDDWQWASLELEDGLDGLEAGTSIEGDGPDADSSASLHSEPPSSQGSEGGSLESLVPPSPAGGKGPSDARPGAGQEGVRAHASGVEKGGEAEQEQGLRPGFRIVICVATTPARIWAMAPMLDSLRQQTVTPDAIYVSVLEGAEVPDFVLGAADLILVTHPPPDLGPVHKLLDCARLEDDPATAILTVDDDMRLAPHVVAALVRAAASFPHAAVGLSGWDASGLLARSPPAFAPSDFVGQHVAPARLPAAVDVLEGYAGVVYWRHFLELDQLADVASGPPQARFADDVWISGLLASWGIPRIVVPLGPVSGGRGAAEADRGEGREAEVEGRHGLSLEYMFGHVWMQVGSQAQALKGHAERGVRNAATAHFFRDFWGPVPF